MIYALYDRNGRRLGAAATRGEAERIRQAFRWDDPPPPWERVASIPTIREEPGEAFPSGQPTRREAVERIHRSLDPAASRGEIEP
jgi:hypothetical protein